MGRGFSCVSFSGDTNIEKKKELFCGRILSSWIGERRWSDLALGHGLRHKARSSPPLAPYSSIAPLIGHLAEPSLQPYFLIEGRSSSIDQIPELFKVPSDLY